METLRIPCIGLGILGWTAAAAAEPSDPLLNIVLLVGDDHGYPYHDFMGDGNVVTPGMDASAAGGVPFTQAQVAAPVCTPSLRSLIYGGHPVPHSLRASAIIAAQEENVSDSPGSRTSSCGSGSGCGERLLCANMITSTASRWVPSATPTRGWSAISKSMARLLPRAFLAGSLLVSNFLFLLLPLASAASAIAPVVQKVEPPNWWANHSLNPVRLLVRGRNLHGAQVAATTAGVTPGAVVVNPSGRYLFVSVAIAPHASAGTHSLTLTTRDGTAAIPFWIEAPLDPATNFQGLTNDDVVYLIMTDRFANGDPSNDRPQDAPPNATDRSDPLAYHGGDFRGIIKRLPYLKDLGVTALWLTPWCDNWNGIEGEGERRTTYYHGYHTIDYYSVEDRFGDMATLRELVREAHRHGLKIIQDQVANHVGIRHPWIADPPLDNWFHPRQFSRSVRADVLVSPHTPAAARRLFLNRWFTDRAPDLNQEEPEVVRYEIQNALWWIGMTGIDGIRQDTVHYLPRPFIRELSYALHREFPRIWMVGEAWQTDPVHVAFFLGGRTGWDGIDTLLDSAIDFPLWQVSRDVFTGAKPVNALRELLRHDGLYSDANRLMTMVANHDAPRFPALSGSTPTRARLHAAFILSIRGIPQLYYGDEIALAGGPDHGSNRADFPGGFPGDVRDAFEPTGRTAEQRTMFGWIQGWLRLRREYQSLRRGAHLDLAWDQDSYVYARRAGGEIVVIAINLSGSARELQFPAAWLDSPVTGMRSLLGAAARAEMSGETVRIQAPPESITPFLATATR